MRGRRMERPEGAAPLRGNGAAGSRRSRSGLRRLVGALLLVPLIAGVLLLVLALVYSVAMPPSTLMLGRWLTLRPVDRTAVPLSAISTNLVSAVIASEDQRFCLHRGVDWGALTDVVDDAEGPSRGASTLSMQVAKNVFLWPGRSYLRKALEIPLASALDIVWGKRRMLEIYLNVAEWGDGVYGAQAAARHWFGKDARDLTRREAALLAVTLPNPILRDPRRPRPGLRQLAGRIEGRMPAMAGLMGCLRE